MKTGKINILGTEYTVEERGSIDDETLEKCDGYCDKSIHLIVVTAMPRDNELEDFAAYQRKVLRHEVIHAFLFESGLHECWTHATGHDETYVDWIASQWAKIAAVFEQLGCER